ncbi:uncharacterized protein LOC105200895 isoform X2 [Solenopsis invicta]|uniref:uncharacterized protein LOC105200895 isoform X2 n=1 Tax=Solenopsis invicta TaxID=13686 RepID=UPI000595C92D|nr:uncharacterized protein LOC105200895 isoform X2 [Solenopsis invicta]XP_025986061.1 uncharacterized protein LOC105200895 isoform X2 [Solenopsis invicta]
MRTRQHRCVHYSIDQQVDILLKNSSPEASSRENMGKKPRNSTDQETLKPQRKRRKTELNRIHSRILQAKRKLDNDEKDDKVKEKKQGRPKICKRLLPEPVAGIYRNGAKGKDIQKAETTTNTYHKARLKADALKLFSGDTHESKCIVEVPIRDKTTEQSSNKDCMKNGLEWTPCTLEESPILGTRQNRNHEPYLVKKKGEENVFEVTDVNKVKKQNVNNETKCIQKENVCKRRLFQNNEEQVDIITTPTQTFNNTDLTKENKFNEKDAKQTCSKSSKDLFCDPLSRYMEFCRIISAKNFEVDILPNHPDPVATTMKKLKNIYADSYRQQLLRKRKRELENIQSAYSVEHQACTSSDISQLSPVEFEVSKCSENHIAARLQGVPQKDNKLTQKAEFKKNNDIRRYSSTSCSSRNTRAVYNANCSIMENCENSETQCQIQSKDNHQLPKSKCFHSTNKKNFMQLESQENINYVNNLLKSKRHDKDNFSIDIPGNEQHFNNSKNFIFSNNDVLSEKYLKDYSRERLSIAVSDDGILKNASQKYNNKTTNKWNIKNIKRAPTILRRYNNVIINKPGDSVQINYDYAKGLHEKSNLLNRNSSNSMEKELYETSFPTDVLTNLPTSNTMNATLQQTKILEPQIDSMKIKDSQDSQVEQYHINMRSKEHRRNGFCRCDDSLYPRTVEASYDTSTSAEKLPQQEQISLGMRKHTFHSDNYHPSNYLQGVNFSNSNVEPTKQFLHQTKLHACEIKKQEFLRKNTRDRNQNILLNNDRTVPTTIFTEVNFCQDNQTEKRFTESFRENPRLYDKTDVECAKNQINQNAYHCNEQYIYYDPANCPRKYKEQAHYFHKEIAQPENLCDTRANYNNSTDNFVNLSSTTRNVPLVLSLKQKNNLHTYSNAIDEQHRAVLVQNVTQPVKYLAVENDSNIQRIPVYINDDKSVKIVENVPLKVIALMNSNTQTNAFPQESARQVVPLQTDGLHLNDFTTRKISDQSFVKRLNPVEAILLNPDSQSNIWYASNL